MNILLDLDGVLCDLVSSALKVNGYSQGHDDIRSWSIAATDDAAFWKRINQLGYKFWTELKPYPWMHDLVDLVSSYDSDWTIATCPSNCESYTGKALWIEMYFPGHKPMIGAKKQLLNGLLIDDYWENDPDILFPQPWTSNYYYGIDRVEYVAEQLQIIVG